MERKRESRTDRGTEKKRAESGRETEKRGERGGGGSEGGSLSFSLSLSLPLSVCTYICISLSVLLSVYPPLLLSISFSLLPLPLSPPSLALKRRVNIGLTRLLIKVKGPICTVWLQDRMFRKTKGTGFGEDIGWKVGHRLSTLNFGPHKSSEYQPRVWGFKLNLSYFLYLKKN